MSAERVVVALSGDAGGQALVERARTLAADGGSLAAVHVARSGRATPLAGLEELRLLVDATGGSWHALIGDDVARAVTSFAVEAGATQVVVGGLGLARRLTAAGLDVHVVAGTGAPSARRPAPRTGLASSRQWLGALLGGVLLCGGTPALVATRNGSSLGSELLLYLLGVVLVAIVGGLRPAVVTAVLASLAVDFWFVPPLHRLSIRDGQEVLSLIVFVAVALLVSSVVELAARRSLEAARAGAEAETLSTLAGSVLRGEQALPALLARVCESFGAATARLLELDAGGAWQVVASAAEPLRAARGADTTASMAGATGGLAVPLGERLRLEVSGPELSEADQRVLVAFAAHAAVVLEQRRLAEVEAGALRTAEADRVRTALLAAVSHDLRTPLAAAKTAVSGLLDTSVDWRADQRRDLLSTADESLDGLTRLVDDLLDMSRLQAGVLPVHLEPVLVEDVVQRAVAAGDPVEVDVDPLLPAVHADPVLLERVLANLVQNAVRYGPPVHVTAEVAGEHVQVLVADRGPGIPPARVQEAFAPFQRLGDRPVRDGAGVGLGLAIARGLAAAMDGTLEPSETPGGGLTMTLRLPRAVEDDTARARPPALDSGTAR